MRRLLALALVLPLSGCTLFCPSGEDCSYVYVGISATATFADEWNATRALEGARAAGFADATTVPISPNASIVTAGAFTFQAGPLPAGGFTVVLSRHDAPGHTMSHGQVVARADGEWAGAEPGFLATLGRFENATGWRHVGPLAHAPLEGIA